jgi:hypothetical protein
MIPGLRRGVAWLGFSGALLRYSSSATRNGPTPVLTIRTPHMIMIRKRFQYPNYHHLISEPVLIIRRLLIFIHLFSANAERLISSTLFT